MCFSQSKGSTVGAHRLWSHRTFKANLPVEILMTILQTYTFQQSIYRWARNHRVHHKYSDTDADPYGSNRGFIFAQFGWVLLEKTPEFKEKGFFMKICLKSEKFLSFFLLFYKKSNK